MNIIDMRTSSSAYANEAGLMMSNQDKASHFMKEREREREASNQTVGSFIFIISPQGDLSAFLFFFSFDRLTALIAFHGAHYLRSAVSPADHFV